uniref:Uncharacterized protein n=1 Tax=Mycena chlorophos TaxID=658473 RepID=A0ABQ0LIC9_MYCCL|nr:predicted protein [Mycena chlorophos]
MAFWPHYAAIVLQRPRMASSGTIAVLTGAPGHLLVFRLAFWRREEEKNVANAQHSEVCGVATMTAPGFCPKTAMASRSFSDVASSGRSQPRTPSYWVLWAASGSGDKGRANPERRTRVVPAEGPQHSAGTPNLPAVLRFTCCCRHVTAIALTACSSPSDFHCSQKGRAESKCRQMSARSACAG